MNPFIAKDDGKYVLFSITFAVVPYVGTWIEILSHCTEVGARRGRSLRGNVDRNCNLNRQYRSMGLGRSLRGNVDRNRHCVIIVIDDRVVPYVGTWIEINVVNTLSGSLQSFPTWERG